jgi:chemotaxis protein methyltransferase CheR
LSQPWGGEGECLERQEQWAFEALKELLLRQRGFDLEAYKERCILRRLMLRARSRGHEGLGDYYRELLHDPGEVDNLFHYLTIHVTQFLRNPGAFRYLRSRILPQLAAAGRPDQMVRIWSAGCASGEEPYTMAILMKDLEREGGEPISHHIYATDVDDASLQKAHRGMYARDALRSLAREEVERWFVPAEGGLFRVRDELRRNVTFRHADILNDAPARRQNLVLCRNLLIYLSRGEQERVLLRLAAALAPGGYMLLGKAESLIGRNRNHFSTVSPTERIYQKRDLPLEGEAASPTS